MKKNDMILIAAAAVLALAAFAGVSLYSAHNTREPRAVVTVDGAEYGVYPLTEDTEVKIKQKDGSYNLLVIQDGMADITDASCPDKICVHHKPVDKKGETLVCLPNKVVVEIVNGEESDVDGSTR